jgi:pyridoxine 5-phosphate synthase
MSAVYDDFKSRVFPAFKNSGIDISLFLDPNLKDIELAHELGADAVELHTGTFANADNHDDRQKELDRLKKAALLIHESGMTVNAGHGLNLDNLPLLLDHVPHLGDISIGHALISKAVYLGLDQTVKEYLKLMKK